jgi:N-acetylglucosamine-6-sulfatase
LTRMLVLFVAALGLAGAVIALSINRDDPPQQAAPNAPNFIVIMTDDQALNTWKPSVMPRTFARMVDGGTDFKEAFAVPPLCCPARASFLTGRYPHNHGVVTNNYRRLADKEDVLPVWLSEAGYQTMFAGKFLNGYEREGTNRGLDPAPGWGSWWGLTGDERRYFDYEASVDGIPKSFGTTRSDYVTNTTTEAALDFMRAGAKEDSPYFLWIAHQAPHTTSRDTGSEMCPANLAPTPLQSDLRRTRGVRLPTKPNYYESNVKDKPKPIRSEAPRPVNPSRPLKSYRCSVAAMTAVDRGVERVFRVLEETGEADDTVVFFISDNGFFFGEHRKGFGKALPYDAATRVPLAIAAPRNVLGGLATRPSKATVGTIDLAPTMLELAGLEGVHRTDGRSLVSLLRGDEKSWPLQRKLVLELGVESRCTGFRALRQRSTLYTEYRRLNAEGECSRGARELYDARRDPFLLRNRLGTRRVEPTDTRRADDLSAKLEELGSCSGIEGRDPPVSQGFCP